MTLLELKQRYPEFSRALIDTPNELEAVDTAKKFTIVLLRINPLQAIELYTNIIEWIAPGSSGVVVSNTITSNCVEEGLFNAVMGFWEALQEENREKDQITATEERNHYETNL